NCGDLKTESLRLRAGSAFHRSAQVLLYVAPAVSSLQADHCRSWPEANSLAPWRVGRGGAPMSGGGAILAAPTAAELPEGHSSIPRRTGLPHRSGCACRCQVPGDLHAARLLAIRLTFGSRSTSR